MRLGVHENYQGPTGRSVDQTLNVFPLAQVTREFEAGILQPQDLVVRCERRCTPIWSAGKGAVWSFKPAVDKVMDGTWKPYIDALGKYLAGENRAAHTVVVIWHEPENDMAPETFVKMYNTVHDWLKAASGGVVQTSHAAMGFRYRNLTVDQAAKWVTKADIHSIDLYSGRSFPLGMTLADSKAFGIWKKSRPAGSRWGVSERGWIADGATSAERVAAIQAEAEHLRSLSPEDHPDFYIVWNTPGIEQDDKIVLDPAAVAAVNDMFIDLSSVECPLCHGTGKVMAGTQPVVNP